MDTYLAMVTMFLYGLGLVFVIKPFSSLTDTAELAWTIMAETHLKLTTFSYNVDD